MQWNGLDLQQKLRYRSQHKIKWNKAGSFYLPWNNWWGNWRNATWNNYPYWFIYL